MNPFPRRKALSDGEDAGLLWTGKKRKDNPEVTVGTQGRPLYVNSSNRL
jgi:hypothetical protein